ncbi:MAG TPA: DUF3300 domain-containing protein [Pseudomonadales bacterium]|nr:DUF3300 domain-containing protein [Pseudomonadales bacterium]
MKALLRCLLSLLLLTSYGCAAQPREEAPLFSQAELDQMLAPIALYPDQLLSQLLMAATYPLEVVQAARWSREHPGLKGPEAVRAVEDRAWDPSVKSLVAFPDLLAQMDADLDWTERLGDAFLAQQQQVMDTVQSLRQRAYDAGNLRSGEQVRTVRERELIYVRPAYPDVIYVPYYDPFTIYGSWWWPDYRPVYWAPWPSYGVSLGYASHGGFYWGAGYNLGVGFFFSDWDWHRHHVRVVDYRPFYYRRPPYAQHIWVHDYSHRRGVPYRHRAVEHRYVPVDSRPVRRHDYGDYRDSDRDYRYRDGERRDDRRSQPGQEPGREFNRAPERNRDRSFNTDRATTGPATIEPRTVAPGENGVRRDNGMRRETMPQPADRAATPPERYREARGDASSRPDRIREPRDSATSRPERIREPRDTATARPESIREPWPGEPGMQRRTATPRASEAPLQRPATPREVQRYPAPRNVQREMPERVQPEALPRARSYPQAAPAREPRSDGGGFVAPDRGTREPLRSAPPKGRSDMSQERGAQRSDSAGGFPRGDRGDHGDRGTRAGRGFRDQP